MSPMAMAWFLIRLIADLEFVRFPWEGEFLYLHR